MFNHDLHQAFGVIAGLFASISYLLYTRAILKGLVKPQRATWFIWSTVSILLLTGLLATGEKEMILVPWAYAIGSSFIFILSLFYGVGGWAKLDLACISCAAISLMVWKIMGTPELPILINLFADLMGGIPTVKKAWQTPLHERNAGWIFFTAGGATNLLAVSRHGWNVVNNSYTVYMFVLSLLITTLIYRPVRSK